MEFWAEKMPEGMLLRSPRIASNISDPDSAFTLDAYEELRERNPLHRFPSRPSSNMGAGFGTNWVLIWTSDPSGELIGRKMGFALS